MKHNAMSGIAELGEYSDSSSANDRKCEEMQSNNTKQ